MLYVEQSGGKYFSVTAGDELMYEFLHQFLITAMEAWGRPIYQHKVASLKVSDNNLHFRASRTLMMDICVLIEATCS